MILTLGDLLKLSEQYYFVILTFVSVFTALLWFLYIYHNKIFIVSSAVFAAVSFMIMVPQLMSFSSDLNKIIINHKMPQSLQIGLFFIIILIALVTFLLFAMEFVMRMHSVFVALGFALTIIVLLYGRSVSVINIILILTFEIGFTVSNMTEKRNGKNVMAVDGKKRINVISAVVAASIAAAALVPAFIIENNAESGLYDLADTADVYVKDTIARLSGYAEIDGINFGAINRGNLHRTGQNQMSIYLDRYPRENIYLRSYTGKYYSDSYWQDAFTMNYDSPRIGYSEFYDYFSNPYKENFMDSLIVDFYNNFGGLNLPYSYHYLIGNSSDPISEMYFLIAKSTSLNENYFVPTTIAGQHVLETPPEEEKKGYISNSSAYNILISNIANRDSDIVYLPYYSRDSKTRVLSNPNNFGDGYYRNQYLPVSMIDASDQWEDNPYYSYFREYYKERMTPIYTNYSPAETPQLESYCKQIKLTDLNEITTYILVTLNNNAVYSTTPGNTPYNKDVIDYFLFENGKGYCVHFASAAALMYRMFGIPARYVSGYVAQPGNFSPDPDYSGYYSTVLTDYSAHAWVEIFLDDYGWVPVEVTPDSSNSMNASYPGFNMAIARTIMDKYGWHFRGDIVIDDDDSDGSGTASADRRDTGFVSALIFFIAAAAAAVAVIILRRIIIIKKYQKADCRHWFDRLIRMLHFSGVLLEYSGSEKDFAQKLSEHCPSVSTEQASRLVAVMLSDNYSETRASPEDEAFIRDVYSLAAKDLYTDTFILKKPVFKFIKVFS